MLTSGEEHGRIAGETVLRILEGEKVSTIPIILKSPNRLMFDYNELNRFGIPLRKIPKESIIINKPPTFYQQYTGLFWTALGSLTAIVACIAALSVNIIRRKQAQQRLKHNQRELENIVLDRTKELKEINEELTSFAYSVSHDLRSPLRAINGFASIIANRHQSSLNEEGQRYFKNIIKASEHMGTLIDDLLNYSRLGRKSVLMRPISVLELLREVQGHLRSEIESERAVLEFPKEDITVHADRTLLMQIVVNLMNNALKYHETDVPPHISVGYETNENHITLHFTDNGLGIKPEYQEKIFNVFQRLHSDAEFPGTGVGLAIVKKAVQMMKGDVWVESDEGKGSVFSVRLDRELEKKEKEK
jgi:signal transduction histidine kinase